MEEGESELQLIYVAEPLACFISARGDREGGREKE